MLVSRRGPPCIQGREGGNPDLCVDMGDVVAVAGVHGFHLLLHLPDDVRDLHIVADCSTRVLLHVHDESACADSALSSMCSHFWRMCA